MWREIHERTEVDFSHLDELLDRYRSLVTQCHTVPPNPIETDALATFLHSIYSCIENVMKRIHHVIFGRVQKMESWHADLLAALAKPHGAMPPVLSEELHRRLRAYLQFRHVFRNSYAFELKWDKMAPLVLEADSCARQFHVEVRAFIMKQPTSGH